MIHEVRKIQLNRWQYESHSLPQTQSTLPATNLERGEKTLVFTCVIIRNSLISYYE
jgi:hypothetical protein